MTIQVNTTSEENINTNSNLPLDVTKLPTIVHWTIPTPQLPKSPKRLQIGQEKSESDWGLYLISIACEYYKRDVLREVLKLYNLNLISHYILHIKIVTPI